MSDHTAAADSPLSAAGAEVVLTRAGQLASAGMPLPAGLRAAADEADSPRVARGLRRLAAEVERGRPLETIVAELRLPAHLKGLLQAAQRTGHFGAVLAEWMENRRAARLHWRSIEAAVAYPLIVLGMTIAVYVLFLVFLVRPFR
ncbi:MAG TPA: type II secretion system F family protein, partial [Pirellulaceae bacterium]|nr:type II secretion system F family protein [Pirellulaceae bacterium]